MGTKNCAEIRVMERVDFEQEIALSKPVVDRRMAVDVFWFTNAERTCSSGATTVGGVLKMDVRASPCGYRRRPDTLVICHCQ